jgi:hypothetical protein
LRACTGPTRRFELGNDIACVSDDPVEKATAEATNRSAVAVPPTTDYRALCEVEQAKGESPVVGIASLSDSYRGTHGDLLRAELKDYGDDPGGGGWRSPPGGQ